MTTLSPKKLLFVANTSWSLVKFRWHLFQALMRDGHTLLLAAPEDEESDRLRQLGVQFIPLKRLAAKGQNPLHDLLFEQELRQLYQHFRPDLIFHYTIKPNIFGSRAAYACGIPSVAVVTGLGYTFIKGGWMSRLTRKMYKHAFRRSREVWFLNQEDQQYFHANQLVDAQKTLLLPGEGIDTEHDFNPQLVSGEQIPKRSIQGLKLLFVGRLLYDKGLQELVDAMRIVKAKDPEISCHLLGYLHVQNPSAIDASTLQNWVGEGLVSYLGSTADVRPVMLSHDCQVLPSYREGMSTTLQEAASLALPLIATQVSGCQELVEDGVTGYLCEVKSAHSLADAIFKMKAQSPDNRVKMGQLGREKMRREFSCDQVYLQYVQAIARLTTNRNNY